MYSLKCWLWLVTFLCSFLLQTKAECNKEEDVWNCNSLEDVKNSDLKLEWTVLVVRNPGGNSPAIEANTFVNTPNVEHLSIQGVGDIKYNAFKGLQKLRELHFDWNNIAVLKAGILRNLPIMHLFMYNCNIQKLQPRSFDNLANLKNVFIHKNSISHLDAGVFSYTDIEVLFLNENGIRTIEYEAFYGMDKLRKLALERNFIISFDPRLYIGNTSPELRLLWLARNNITTIHSEGFAGFPNLRVLLYHINFITHIADNAFKNLQQLHYLDISNNRILELRPTMFPEEGLKNLDTFFIHNNHLTFLANGFLNKLPNLQKITIGGNPWKCPCYTELRERLHKKNVNLICDDKYFTGSRPVCLTPDSGTLVCEESTRNSENDMKIFNQTMKDYEALPPLCKIYCDGGKSCYSHDFDVIEYN